MSVGIPVKLMYEGLGHTVTMEVRRGEVYRGTLSNVEDNMNCLVENATMTHKDGKVSHVQQVYIRGGQIRFCIFPDMLRHSPMFKLAGGKGRGRALGLGGQRRALAMRARAGSAMGGGRGGRGRRGRGRDMGDD